jgi:hypothetical protein
MVVMGPVAPAVLQRSVFDALLLAVKRRGYTIVGPTHP